MPTIDETKLKHEFLQRWKDLEKILREVASDQMMHADLNHVLSFLLAIEQIERGEKNKLNIYRTARGLMSQPGAYIDDSVQKEIDDFMLLADELEKRLRPLMRE